MSSTGATTTPEPERWRTFTPRSTSLPVLAEEIEQECAAVDEATQSALEHARRAGELLIQAKSQVKHGQWKSWVEAHLTIGMRSVQGYMRLAREWDHLVANTQAPAHLTLEAALALLAKPIEPEPDDEDDDDDDDDVGDDDDLDDEDLGDDDGGQGDDEEEDDQPPHIRTLKHRLREEECLEVEAVLRDLRKAVFVDAANDSETLLAYCRHARATLLAPPKS